MKIIYQTNGATGYSTKILGYSCGVFETKSGLCQVSVPYGKTAKEIEMFDSLVYYHPEIYNGKDKKTAVKQVREFIKVFTRCNK